MPLSTGSRLGCYEIVSPLGSGGMGEVYRARDTKLHRDVALKILPPVFGLDGDRVARFKREAQVLASLNHPNIAAIHGFEDSTEPPALALELVEGPTLAERIAQGPMPFEDVLPIARQICEALEAAHEQGIVHRDLKPANIKIRSDGTVKVLDFGLAKAVEPAAPDRSDAMLSPTITSPALTQIGLILGTASYMSPEQAKGRPADKRSDVWAFGCVLFEMLTGKRPFEGEEVSDTLASVLKIDPDWNVLPASLPPAIRTLIEGCLKKDRRDRIADISTARFVLNQSHAVPVAASATQSVRGIRGRAWKAAGLLVLAVVVGVVAAVAAWSFRPRPAVQVSRFAVPLPPGQQFTTLARQIVTISPDGTTIAFAASGRLYVRSMSDLEPRPVPGAEQAIGMVFSPDSQWLAFYADFSIKRIAVSGGAPITIYRGGSAPPSLTWDESGILFPLNGTGIVRVSPDGGKPEVLVPLSLSHGFAHGPRMLPDRETLLFTLTTDTGLSTDRWDAARIVAQSLKTGKRETIIEPGTDARFVSTGHIVYALGGTVFARPFDPATLRFTGSAIPVIDGVQRVISDTGTAQFDFSNSGSLVYLKGPRSAGVQQFFAFDRKAGREVLKLPPGPYRYPRVSPDGKRLAFESSDGKEAFVAVYDLSGRGSPRRLTFGGNNRFPVWSRDGTHVAFQSDRARDPAVFWQAVEGGVAEQLTRPEPGTSHVPETWSPTGDVLLFNVVDKAKTSLWTLSIRDRTSAPLGDITSAVIPTDAVFSPDGRWVAYQAGERGSGGEGGLFVQPFPPTGTKYQIARIGGRPLWSRDGKELFFLPAPGQFMVVGVTTHPTFTFTDPVALSRGFGASGPLSPRMFDMMADGRILGLASPVSSSEASPDVFQIHVVLNWFEELRARAPSR